MALKKRERNLAIATAVLLSLFLVRFLWSTLSGPEDPLEIKRAELTQKIEQQKRQIQRGKEAGTSLSQWQQQSLPSNLEAARSLYQNWLLATAESSGFKATRVDTSPGRQQGNAYRVVRFRLQAETTLADLTRFLHTFYSKGFLHQIQGLTLQPRDNGKKIDVQATIEALALLGANRTNKLPETAAASPLAATLLQYTEAITGRNFFAPVRIVEEATPQPPAFETLKHVYVTAIVGSADHPEAWLVNRTSGERLKLHPGDEFRIGEHRGKVQAIDPHGVTVELDGKTCLLSLGSALENAGSPP